MTPISSSSPSSDSTLQQLRNLRSALLRLHKALLESERTTYEQSHGRIRTSGEFFKLVIEHEWFSWLRPISQLIVQIDEALAAKEPVTPNQAKELLQQVRTLLNPSEAGTTLEKQYYLAIQRDPDIAFMHAEMAHLLMSNT